MSEDGRKRQIIWCGCILLVGVGLVLGINKLRSVSLVWRHPKPTPAASEPSGVTEPGVVTIEEVRAPRTDRLVIDARPSLFFKQGHLPGAINLAKQSYAHDFSLHESVLNTFGNRQIVVYCASSECEDAPFVATKLLSAGLKRVYVFPGGWEEWQAARKT